MEKKIRCEEKYGFDGADCPCNGRHESNRGAFEGRDDEGGFDDERAHRKDARSHKRGKRNKELGARGEEAAARFLVKRGYDIVERNWKCYAGEVDIIARDEETLIFVEVKTRKDCQKGFPAEAVNADKRTRYEKIALEFLKSYEVVDLSVRFDVISIVVVSEDRALIRHHISAFSVA